jgi:uncharacterized protein (DUF1697 family)
VPRYAVLLRAVNVGGANKLPMAALRDALTKAGQRDVATYIQSGNVALTSPAKKEADVAAAVAKVIAKSFGLDVGVVARTHAQLAALAHPFGDGAETKRVHVVFFSAAPTKAAVASLDPNRSPGDVFVVRGAEMYLHTPAGMGQSKLTMDWLEKRLGVTGTARNWNTVQKMVELTRG